MSILTPHRRNNLLSLLNEDMDQLLNPTSGRHWSQMISGKNVLTDIIEHDDAFEIVMDAPGYDKNNIDIHVDDNNFLTVTGKHATKSQEELKGKYLHIERESSQFFSRKVRLPDDVNKASIRADYKKGVLTVTLPKASKKESKRHQIKVNEITEE